MFEHPAVVNRFERWIQLIDAATAEDDETIEHFERFDIDQSVQFE